MHKAAVIVLLMLAGCGGGSSDGSQNGGFSAGGGGPDYDIKSFDIQTPSGDSFGGDAQINPGVSGGAFVPSWSVEDASSLYTAALYLSSDTMLSAGDQLFFDEVCGSVQAACPDAASTSVDCTFNSSNVMQCSGQPEDAVDLTAYLPGLPYNGYIILESCDSSGLDCVTASHPVVLQ